MEIQFQCRILFWIFLSFIICVAAEPIDSYEESFESGEDPQEAEHEMGRRSPNQFYVVDESPEFESAEEEVAVNRRGSYYDYRGEDDYFPDPGARNARQKPKPILGCKPQNAFCYEGKDCCTGICTFGHCSESSCTPLNGKCSYGRDCCTMRCKGRKCVPCPPNNPYCS